MDIGSAIAIFNSAIFQILEQCAHWYPRAAEHPGTAEALGISLHRSAASPADCALLAHAPILADF
jgi:hypothetical protein